METVNLEVIEEVVEEDDSYKVFRESFDAVKEYDEGGFQKEIIDLFESCNINFLMGSGYSISKLRTLGNLEEMIEQNSTNNSDNSKMMGAIETLILFDFFRNSIFPHKYDLETNTAFDSSDQFILKLIGLLSRRNDKNLLKRVNLFTTNYDMFFELSLEKNKVYYNDGFGGRLRPKFSTDNYNKIIKQIVQNSERESQIPTVNLYKLHGSLAWNQMGTDVIFNTNPIDSLDKIHNSGNVFNRDEFCYDVSSNPNINNSVDAINLLGINFNQDLVDGIDAFSKSYQELHIINPTKKKFEETLFSNIYYDLLRMYSNELEKNNSVLFVFGFSFKDEHIYNITKRALSNPSMRMYIFIYNSELKDSFKALFEDHHNVFYVYCHNKNIDLEMFSSLMFGG